MKTTRSRDFSRKKLKLFKEIHKRWKDENKYEQMENFTTSREKIQKRELKKEPMKKNDQEQNLDRNTVRNANNYDGKKVKEKETREKQERSVWK